MRMELLTTLRIELLLAARGGVNATWVQPYVYSPFARFFYIMSGQGVMEHHSRRFELCPRHIYLIPSDSRLSYRCPQRMDMYYIHFRAWLLDNLDFFQFYPVRYRLAVENPRQTCRDLESICQAYRQPQNDRVILADGALRRLLAPFLVTPKSPVKSNGPGVDLPRFKHIVQHIITHQAERIRVGDLAKMAHLEANYFARVFKKALGLTPIRFIVYRRLETAKRLLLQTNMKLEEMAQQLGFFDAYHFSKTFRKLIGASPRQYRVKHGSGST